MASALYTPFKQALLNKEHDLDTDDLRAILVDTAQYTFSAAHSTLADVPSGARQAVSGTLASRTLTNGVLDAADITITGGIAATAEAIVVYSHTGAESAKLICYFDGLSIPITAADIIIRWNASGLFAV